MVICKNCGIENDEDSEFCKKCGEGILQLNKNQNNTKKLVNSKNISVGILLIIILLLSIPTDVTVPYQKSEEYQESYIDREPYQVQIPYEDIEYYTEKEPYQEQSIMSGTESYQEQININGSLVYQNERINYTKDWLGINKVDHIEFDFGIQNNDMEHGGTFTIKANFIPVINDYIKTIPSLIPGLPTIEFDIFSGGTLSGSIYIPSNSIKIITIPISNSYKLTSYDIIYPNKIITKYRPISSVETLTKYKDVQKSRTVTKYRTETKYKDVQKQRPSQKQVTDYKQIQVMMVQRILGWY